MEKQPILIAAIAIALLAFAFAAWLYVWVNKQPSSNEKIAKIGGFIRKGANTYFT
jgi:K(+)-stimulated pyrophosphate-energized sodium pump